MEIIKLGGSLLPNADHIFQILDTSNSVIIPGGGCFADNIRDFSQQYIVSNKALHKMAIYSMHQYGIYLSSISNVACIEDLSKKSGIFLPYNILKKHDPFPYSWDVTSDSIAVFIAYLFDVKIVKLIKMDASLIVNKKQIREISSYELKNIEQNIVDKYLITCMDKYKIDCEVYDASSLRDFKKNYISKKYSLKIRCLK
ncbi:MAG: hypothetical protein LBI55_00515 [Oscillospiraceae bacterium]|jgi:aspartokinase-like uncharacterized kinase|nr:hypothetical protein [Oscillospiraceae bacterium]